MKEEQGFEIEKEDVVIEKVSDEEEINENLIDFDDIKDPNDEATKNMHNIAGVLSADEKNSSNKITIWVIIAIIVVAVIIAYGLNLGF